MKIIRTEIPEVFMVEPQVFSDDRGFFFESFNQKKWEEATGLKRPFVQDNHSSSQKLVLRGLHYQINQPQGKLVRVVVGKIFDVAVDLRRESKTFCHWFGVCLSATNHRQLWVPEGFAHGFLTLSETAEVLYKTTDYYYPEFDRSLAWDDPEISINWPLDGSIPSLSNKDTTAKRLQEAELSP
ncbi:MAG: dTDP-4-dehydrorhamnose 3,5-epimerase [Deltaproteobacteria bacterium]|nr:dTDP-4-dehydrorhamnose 3,5-epimerase [Deltaproteobacteria bacterium]